MYDYWITNLVMTAVFEGDIESIDKIIQRVDGATPDTATRHLYANYFGEAIDTVMELDEMQKCNLQKDDTVIIALAKSVVAISMQPIRNYRGGIDTTAQRAKQKAIEMIFERAAGRKATPVSRSETITFDEPDWMKGLPYEKMAQ